MRFRATATVGSVASSGRNSAVKRRATTLVSSFYGGPTLIPGSVCATMPEGSLPFPFFANPASRRKTKMGVYC
jgi:hypothetical protein